MTVTVVNIFQVVNIKEYEGQGQFLPRTKSNPSFCLFADFQSVGGVGQIVGRADVLQLFLALNSLNWWLSEL